MKSLRNKNKIHYGKSERCLKIVAVVVSLLFAALMLYPMIFAVSSSMKDNSQIYEVPPKLLPGSANSVSLVFDYSGQEFESEEALKDQMMQDNVLAMFGTNFKLADQSIMEIQVYGTKDGKTLFHSRAHQMKLQMECDYGIYKRTAIKKEILLHDDRYIRACESIGYEFDADGIDKKVEEGLGNNFTEQVSSVLNEKYQTVGKLVSVGDKTKNLLNLESFKYYLDMPAYILSSERTDRQNGIYDFCDQQCDCYWFCNGCPGDPLFRMCFCDQQTTVKKNRKICTDVFPGRNDGSFCKYYASSADHV